MKTYKKSQGSKVLIVLTGAYGNIGDGVIRRRVIGWVRNFGQVHAYVGNAPEDWIEQVGLRETDRIYPSSQAHKWLAQMMMRPAPKVLMFDPGEVPLGLNAWRSELVFLALSFVGKLRRVIVVRPPRGVGKYNTFVGAIHRFGARMSSVTMWRNEKSLALIKHGVIVPDTAFQEPAVDGVPWDQRDVLIISMRGKRAFPSDNWFACVEAIAASLSLRTQVLSQVREDESRSGEISRRLRAEHVVWGDDSDLNHERKVRENYERAAVVLSDRLHVLVLAAISGAVPTELVDAPRGKVREHFAQIGIVNLDMDTSTSTPEQSVEFVRHLCSNRSDMKASIIQAREFLNEAEAKITSIINATPSRR